MEYYFFESIDSTQDFLKRKLKENKSSKKLLACALSQTAGYGQRKAQWLTTNNSIAMSFNIAPCAMLTLTSLEIGLLCCHFFSEHFNQELFLKWPNDIYNKEHKKVGGILLHTFDNECIVGIGINLQKNPQSIENSASLHLEADSFEISYKLHQYIFANRMSPSEILEKFKNKCFHLKQNVVCDKTSGEFLGIDEFGRALIQNENNEITALSSGPLTFF